jgi:hypothetical protein
MQSHQSFAKYPTATIATATLAISVLAGAIVAASAMLGAPAGVIVLGETSRCACIFAFALLIWAAIQDGK